MGTRINSTNAAVVRRAGTQLNETKVNVGLLPPPVPLLLVQLVGAQPWTGHGADRGLQPHRHDPRRFSEAVGFVRFGGLAGHSNLALYTGLFHPLTLSLKDKLINSPFFNFPAHETGEFRI